MQEPGQLREMMGTQLARIFPEGVVIKQEEVAPYRVQVRIPLYHTGVSDEDLPYYRVGFPTTASGHNGRGGHFSTLTPGTHVVCLIYDSRGYNGIVFLVLGNNSNDIKDGSVYGYRDDFGNHFRVDAEGNMVMTSKDGASVSMLADGKIKMVANDLELNIGGITINAETISMLATGITQTAQDWQVDASNPIITEGGDSGEAPQLTVVELPETPDVANKTDM